MHVAAAPLGGEQSGATQDREGGKREPGETDIDTLAREIDEELAVTIR